MQQCQTEEAVAINKMGAAALTAKLRILELLSQWLSSLKRSHQTDVQEMEQFTTIAFEQWIELQSFAQEMETEVKAALEKEKGTSADYYAVARLGHASKLFADAAKKSQIKDLEYHSTTARQHREHLQRKLNENITQRQAIGERFLRDCIDQIETLSSTKTFGAQVTTILEGMTNDANTVWESHIKQQKEHLAQVSSAVDSLVRGYEPPRSLLSSASTSAQTDKSSKSSETGASALLATCRWQGCSHQRISHSVFCGEHHSQANGLR